MSENELSAVLVPATPEALAAEHRTKSRVLVVYAHGQALALVCEPGITLDFIHESDSKANTDGFVLDEAVVDYGIMPDGVYYGVLSLVDDGPGDWPGSREVCPSLSDVRPVTADEWKAHLQGEWPWDPKGAP